MRWVVVTLLAFGLLSLACGDGGGGTTASAPCTNEATAQAVRTANRGVLMTPGAFRRVDDEIHCRLRRALLTDEDMPVGWTDYGRRWLAEDHILARSGSSQDMIPECGGVPAYGVTAGLQTVSEPDYEATPEPEDGTIWHILMAFRPGGAERFIDGVRHGCELVRNSSEVFERLLTIQEVSQGAVGEESLIVRGVLGLGDWDAPVDWTLVVHREADIASIVGVIGSAAGAEDLARIVQGRIPRIGTLPDPTPLPSAGCPPAATPPSGSRSSELERALLDLIDMSAGYVAAPPEPCGLLGIENSCRTESKTAAALQPEEIASTGFAGPRGSFLSQKIGLFDANDADRAFRSMEERISGGLVCTLMYQDQELLVRYGLAPLPGATADAYAWYASTEGFSDSEELLVYTVELRRGNVLMVLQATSLTATPFGPPDDDDVAFSAERMAPYIAKADQKLAEIEDELADLD